MNSIVLLKLDYKYKEKQTKKTMSGEKVANVEKQNYSTIQALCVASGFYLVYVVK